MQCFPFDISLVLRQRRWKPFYNHAVKLHIHSSQWQASSRPLIARVPRHHHRESICLSSSPNTISVTLRLQATWSRSIRVTSNWMTAFLWRLQTWKSYWALWLTLPSCRHLLHATPDSERMKGTCLLWMSLWSHISAHPRLSDGRQGRVIRPSRAEPHLHTLNAPTRRLDKPLQRFTRWLCSRSSRPGCSPVRTQTSQGAMAQTYSNNPPLEEPAVGVGVIPAARSSPVADPLETGPPLSSERYDMARVMGPACVAAQREPFGLPERILNTMAEARAPSTRCLYALKWSVFSTWCQDRDLDPVTSDVSVVLSFLHETPRPRTVPPWDLPTVLRALKVPPFEPLQSTSLRALLLKTVLLLALSSIKWVGDLQALSINPACLEFGPNDAKVVLKPRLGYVSKELSTPFRAQIIALSALPPRRVARN